MIQVLRVAMVVSGLAPAAVALAALVGLGVIREAPPWAVAVAAVCVVALPCMGIAGVGRHQDGSPRLESVAVALWIWPLMLLVGLPVYFPGERADALSTGMSWLGAAMGQQRAEQGAALGAALAGALGEERLTGTPPRPVLAPEPEAGGAGVAVAAPREDTPRPALEEDAVVLPYEGEGRSLRLPVSFEGPESVEELWMLFDTGATFTTLDEATLNALGVRIPRGAPEVTLQTAGGERTAKLVLIDRLWLGGFAVEGVTVAVCEPCASGGVSGLLGLNVTGQFQVTLDHDRREMVLAPRDRPDRHLDIERWLELDTQLTAWKDGRMELVVEAANTTRRTIASAAVGIACPDERFTVRVTDIGPYDSNEERVSLPRGTRCPEYRVSLDEARW